MDHSTEGVGETVKVWKKFQEFGSDPGVRIPLRNEEYSGKNKLSSSCLCEGKELLQVWNDYP